MSSKHDDLPFQLGYTAYGKNTGDLAADIAASKLKGTEYLGRVWMIEDRGTTENGFTPTRTNTQRLIMAVRNVSGFAVAGKRLVVLESSGLGAFKNINGYANLDYQGFAYPVDEKLTECPDDDICYIVIDGPALVTMSLSQVRDVAYGDPITALTAAATNSTTAGRVQSIDAANTDAALSTEIGVIGWAISATSSSQTGADVLIKVRKHH